MKRSENGVVSCIVFMAAGLLAGPLCVADVASYRETVQAMDGLLDYYPLDDDINDTVDGGDGFNSVKLISLPDLGEGVNGQGHSAVFNGTDNVIKIARSIQGDFTILAWIRTDVLGAGDNLNSQFWQGSGLFYADVGGAANDFGAAITGEGFAFGVGNPDLALGPDQTIHSANPVNTGDWTQIAAVRKVDAGAGTATISIYVNGQLEASADNLNTLDLDAATQILVGGNAPDNRYFNGQIDELALFNAALDDVTIQSFFDTMSSPQGVTGYRTQVKATTGLVDYYDFESDLDDSFDGGNGFNNPDLTAGPTAPTFAEGVNFEFQGAVFDGIDDFIFLKRSIQDSFTILGWMKADLSGIGDMNSQFFQGSGMVYADIGGVNNDFGAAICGTTFAFGAGNPDMTIHSTSDVSTGDWVQFAAVREVGKPAGSSTLRIYINGKLEASLIHPNIQPLAAYPTLTLGANKIDGRFYTGMLDELALFGAALTAAEVQESYNSMLGLKVCFTADKESGNAPLLVKFDAACTTTTGAGVTDYAWDFGDGVTGAGDQASHTYDKPGIYTAQLTVTTQVGTTGSTQKPIEALFPSGDVSPWTSTAIGATEARVHGGARSAGGCIEAYSGGTGLSGVADQFQFIHRGVTGDARITARVSELVSAGDGRVAVMLRENLTPGSRYVAAGLNLATGKFLQLRRQNADKASSIAPSTAVYAVPDVWLRVERKGDAFTASYSTDGTTFNTIGAAVTIAMAGDFYAGLAVTSQDGAGLLTSAQARFCEVQLGGASNPPGAPTGLVATPGPGQVSLDWADSPEPGVGYNVKRSLASGGSYTKLNAAPLTQSAYIDTGLAAGTPYFYVVSAVGPGGESANSTEASATPTGGGAATFRRGDADLNGVVELTDVVNLLGFLFLGAPQTLGCMDAADADDTGVVELTDAIFTLGWLFLGDPKELPAPGTSTCGVDPTTAGDPLDCATGCQ
jgi:PKD repeat protein